MLSAQLRLDVCMLLVLLALLPSCSRPSQPNNKGGMSTRQSRAEPIPAGTLMSDSISYEFAIFYLPQPKKNCLAELDEILNRGETPFRRVEKRTEATKSPTVEARIESNPKLAYAPPDLQSLQYFGRGLSREHADALQQTEMVLILDFTYSKEHVWRGLRSAVELTNALAQETGGLIWDEATREVFSPGAWEQQRIRDWMEDVPDVTKHTVIHAYKKEEFVRAITLGMAKFGLTDVVIDEFSWSLNRNMGHIVNLFAQAIAEGQVIERAGEFILDIKAIKNPNVREPQISTLKPNATGTALLSLKKGIWEEGDPLNRLIEITFDRGIGPDMHAKQEHIVATTFGWEDSATPVTHDEELQLASRQARKKLPALRADFNKGLAPGEFIQVKAPFDTPDGGHEWMWVEVTLWKGDKISGLLKNEPLNIPTLHGGQMVEVSEAKVFDYIRSYADGTQKGNETGRLIEKRSQ